MLPIERQHLIKTLISKKKHMKISELSEMLDVSEMTIHRDLKPLIKKGGIIKTFGGVTVVHKDTPPIINEVCTYCSRALHDKMTYRLILTNNQTEMTCCAHCGLLRHQQLDQQVDQAICHDFLRQTTISAPLAWYVMDTSINIGCCQPQVLTFEWQEHAEKFIRGFGGNVYTFSEASKSIKQKMNGCLLQDP